MLLIVDDDPAFLEAAEQKLDYQSGGVLFARSSQHARSLLETIGPQFGILLVDLDLPDEDGFSLIRQVCRDYPGLPVIAISGVVQSDVLECAKLLGARETLRKPITSEWNQTIARVRAALA